MKNLDVIVDISKAVATGTVGFGTPLILVSKEKTAVPFTVCKDLKAVQTAINDTAGTTETTKIAKLLFGQENVPQQIAVMHSTDDAIAALTAVEDKEWRQLICVIGKDDTKTASDIASLIETFEGKMYFVTVSATSELTALKDKKRTVAFYHDEKSSETPVYPYAAAALVGTAAGQEVGSFTYKNLKLAGVTPLDLTETQVAEIHSAGGITILAKCGDNVTSEGKTMSGEYIDVVDGQDYIQSQIEYNIQKLLNNNPKVPYTNSGISALESVVVSVMEDAYSKGIIADDDGVAAYTVSFKSRDEMSEEDRKNRKYTGGAFSYTVAGAIHEVEIHGELII